MTLFPVWRAPGTFPLLLLVLLCWLTLPACGVSDFCKRIYPSVRAIQLLFLAGLLVMQMAFPQQMKLRGWDSSIKIGKILTGSIVQKDITSEWKSLRWVDNDGEPMVWYSGSPSDGFHLWAAPGRDPRGEELRPMTERKIQDQVVAALQESDRRAQQEQAAKDAEQRRLAEIEKQKQVEADKVRQAAAEAERIRLAVEEAKRRAEQEALAKQTAEKQAELARQTAETQRRDYLARYRRSESLRGAGPGRSAAIFILGDKSQKNEAVGAALAGSLRQPELSVATDFFKPAFGTDGLVEQLLTGSRETGAKLELTNSLDVLLLGRISTSYSTNEALQNLITAESKLELVALSAASLEKLHATEWQSQGAGFKPEDARAAAEERLQKSLPADSLSAFRKTISSMLR